MVRFILLYAILILLNASLFAQNDAVGLFNNSGFTLEERIHTPEGFHRIEVDSNSFESYLRNLPLKEFNTEVLFYNKHVKQNNHSYCAVIDMEIGNQDLQQCADAIMRLRAEYLYKVKKLDRIKFNFVSDGKPRYFIDYAEGDLSYNRFWDYLKYVFSYANTRSLYDELCKVEVFDSIKIGDVLIQKKNPYGHAVIVVDVAMDIHKKKKIYLLAQSYMPAQDIQILCNPFFENNPWYYLSDENEIRTPEWLFYKNDLRRFCK